MIMDVKDEHRAAYMAQINPFDSSLTALSKDELATLGLLLRRFKTVGKLTGNERVNSVLRDIAVTLYVD